MKPDISQLSISTSSSGAYPVPGGSRYIGDSGGSVTSTQGYGYGLHQSHSAGSLTGGGYFNSSMFGGLSGPPGSAPLQSPILNSQVCYFRRYNMYFIRFNCVMIWTHSSIEHMLQHFCLSSVSLSCNLAYSCPVLKW